jgi:hypothetical protein
LARTYRAKGGSSNIVPRYNDWTEDRDICELLALVCGRCVKFTTRSAKNMHYEAICHEYRDKMRAELGIDTWSQQEISRDNVTELLAEFDKPIKDQHLPYFDTEDDQAGFRSILTDPAKLARLFELREQFVQAMCVPYHEQKTHVVTDGHGLYIQKTVSRSKAYITEKIDQAARFSESRAAEVAAKFSGWSAAAL